MSDVLVLRALGLGDLLTSVAALRGLRRARPHARLVLAAPATVGAWLSSLGVVDDVVDVRGVHDGAALSSLPRAPEAAVNLHGCGPESHELLRATQARRVLAYRCRAAGFEDGPEWRVDEHEVDRWLRLVHWTGADADPNDLRLPAPGPRAGHVVLHPGAASGSRRWPARRWAEVATRLTRSGRRIVVTGTRAESELCATVARGAPGVHDACGLHDLPGLARVVATADLVLSGDTGVAHLATAFATPSVTLFGPVSPAVWGARIDPHLHTALWAAPGDDLRPGDPHGATTDERLMAIGVPEVVDASLTLLGGHDLRGGR